MWVEGSEILNFLRSSRFFQENYFVDNMEKSYWFKVFESDCMINLHPVFDYEFSEIYKIRYYFKDPRSMKFGMENGTISFEDFFEAMPEEAKLELIFHLELFK